MRGRGRRYYRYYVAAMHTRTKRHATMRDRAGYVSHMLCCLSLLLLRSAVKDLCCVRRCLDLWGNWRCGAAPCSRMQASASGRDADDDACHQGSLHMDNGNYRSTNLSLLDLCRYGCAPKSFRTLSLPRPTTACSKHHQTQERSVPIFHTPPVCCKCGWIFSHRAHH